VFDVGLPEFLVLAIVAIFVFGPDRLPDVARQAGRLMRQVREMVTAARTQLSDELGPEFADYDIKDMNPRNLVRKHLLDDLDDDEAPVRPGHRPLKQGEQAPYDAEAT
jgi:sec-independent protein translocase protein TatB